MPDITILPANLATLVIESFLYGINLLLFILTVYFLATKRTLAGARRTAKHHFTSLVFLGVTCVFLLVTGHWTIVIYQAFYGFIHLGGAGAADTFYADLSQPSGETVLSHIDYGSYGNEIVALLYSQSAALLVVLVVVSAGLIFQITKWESRLRGALWNNQSKPWEAVGFGLSIL
ncbi:hypothetical protein C8R43DRAFT_1121675 [Mycena crocata]|nr:hypothetical protein C8R43DRAFT_1121675 [Mycena crocata]